MKNVSARARLFILAGLTGLLLLVLLPLLLPSPSVNENKATWVWEAKLIRSQAEEIVSFSMNEGITTIFLQIQQEVRDEDYRRFNALAHQAGIEVHALDGHPEWAYSQGLDEGMKLLSWLERFHAASRPEERFDGIQFDVEPYVRERWEQEQQQVVAEWSINMSAWAREASRQGLYISAAVPFWLDRIPGPSGSGSFSRWIISRMDAIAVMAYRDDGELMYELSRQELEQADELGKQVWIGMELGNTDEGDHLTFYSKSEQAMEEEAQRAATLGSGHPSFAGLAVHHYQAWMDRRMSMAEEER